jgi:hypothetical protein
MTDRAPMDHDAPEREAMRQHYAAPPAPEPYTPEQPDPIRDGLLKGFITARKAKP